MKIEQEPEEAEDLYDEEPEFKKNDAKAIEKAMSELTVEKHLRPRDVYACFMGTDFLYLDFKNDTW